MQANKHILIRHHTVNGVLHGRITYRGRKWMKIHYVAHPRATTLRIAKEERFMEEMGPMTVKQYRRFNQSIVDHQVEVTE